MSSKRCAERTIYIGGVKLSLKTTGVWMLCGDNTVRIRRQTMMPVEKVKLLVCPDVTWKPTPEDFVNVPDEATLVDSAFKQASGRGGRWELDPLAASHDPILWQAATGADPYESVAREFLFRNRVLNPTVALASSETHPGALDAMIAGSTWEVRQAVAKNPYAAPATLARLFKDGSLRVRAAVAGNEGTPADILWEFTQCKDGPVLDALMSNPSLPGRSFWYLENTWKNNQTIRKLGLNPSCPTSLLQKWIDEGRQNRFEGMLPPALTKEQFHLLAGWDNDSVHEQLAGSMKAPAEVLEKLSHSDSVDVRMQVAGNRITPKSVLEQMVEVEEDVRVLTVAAAAIENPELLGELSKSGNPSVCLAVAHNPNTLDEDLSHLAHYSVDRVTAAVMNNPSASFDSMSAAVQTLGLRSVYVSRVALGLDEGTPMLVNHLARQEGAAWGVQIRTSSKLTEDTLRFLAKSGDPKVLEGVAGNVNCPEDLLEEFADSQVDGVREAVARNKRTPSSALGKTTKNLLEKGLVAQHLNAPPEVLAELSQDETKGVRVFVAGNPSTPPATLKEMLERGEMRVVHALASNPSLPQECMEVFSKVDAYGLRILLARNPALPRYMVERLLDDEEELVREEACKRPGAPLGDRARSVHLAYPNRLGTAFTLRAHEVPLSQAKEVLTVANDFILSGTVKSFPDAVDAAMSVLA